jgi:hypothetical protein
MPPANVRLWIKPAGNTDAQAYVEDMLARAQNAANKAFKGVVRASADTWLFEWKEVKDNEDHMAANTYGALRRYLGPWPKGYFPVTKPVQSLQVLYQHKTIPDVIWGRELGEFPWPSEAFKSVEVATPQASPPLSHPASQSKAGSSESITNEPLFLKAVSVLQADAHSLFANYAVDDGDKQREGTFGKVQRAKRPCGMEVVFKRQKKLNPVEFLKELQINVLLQQHPNIAGLLDVIKWEGHPTLVLQAADMDLFAFLKCSHGVEVCWGFLKAACAACAHLHSRNIIHCDIKPDNVLLQACAGRADIEGYRLLLADFGEATTAMASCRELASRSLVQRQSLH